MRSGEIKRILDKYADVFLALEEYDRTHELPSMRKRIDVTLSVKTLRKLQALKQKTGKSISEVIEERVAG